MRAMVNIRWMHARGFWQRLRGLLGSDGLPPATGLLLPGCRAVHTFGMRFPIDVVFIDRDGTIVRLREALVPNRVAWCPTAWATGELAAGSIRAFGLRPGMQLCVPHALRSSAPRRKRAPDRTTPR